MRRLGIFGASGMAREIADIAYELGYEPICIAKDRTELDSWKYCGEVIVEDDLRVIWDADFVIGIGDSSTRSHLAERYSKSLNFVTIIHPSATFGRGQREKVESKKGVVICAGVRFTTNIEIGDFTIINQNATIAHDVRIGCFANIAPGASISGNVHIGESCWIGAGAIINQGTNEEKLLVGRGAVVGSGAVVVRSCDEQSVYVGMPARKIK